MYLLPKIHRRFYDVPWRPVISNCGTPTEKVSELLFFSMLNINTFTMDVILKIQIN